MAKSDAIERNKGFFDSWVYPTVTGECSGAWWYPEDHGFDYRYATPERVKYYDEYIAEYGHYKWSVEVDGHDNCIFVETMDDRGAPVSLEVRSDEFLDPEAGGWDPEEHDAPPVVGILLEDVIRTKERFMLLFSVHLSFYEIDLYDHRYERRHVEDDSFLQLRSLRLSDGSVEDRIIPLCPPSCPNDRFF